MRALFAALAIALAAAPIATFPQQDPDANARVLAAIEAALKQRPNDATLYFYLARVHALRGDAHAATEALLKVEALGDGFLPARQLGFEKVWDDPDFQLVRARLEKKLPRLDYAPNAVELEDRGLIPEGMAYDAPSQSFFVGSAAEHKVVRILPGNEVKDFTVSGAGLDGVLGIVADSPRRVLYVVSTSALTLEGRRDRRNAIFAYDIDSGRFLRRVEVPGAVALNDVAVARGGRVYTTDSGAGAVYEITPENTARMLVKPGDLPGANGLAAAPDAKHLYIAHNTGLAVIDLESGTFKKVANETRENVAAIDGLYEWHGQLVGVQNITTPGRVVLITLSTDGATIIKVQTMLSHHHKALDEPTTGAPTEQGFFLLAATGMAHYNDKGEIDDPDKVPRPTIVRVLLPR